MGVPSKKDTNKRYGGWQVDGRELKGRNGAEQPEDDHVALGCQTARNVPNS